MNCLALALTLAGTCQEPETRTADAEVIETVALSFLTKAEWQVPDWQHGEVVVLAPELRQLRKHSFVANLDEFIAFYGRAKDKRAEPDLKNLRAIRRQVTTAGAPDSDPLSLSDLKLDKRIIVKSLSWNLDERLKGVYIQDRDGKKVRVRISSSIARPIYSDDKQFAFTTVSAGWSIHSADANFILKQVDHKWKVVLVVPYFYV